MHYSLGMLGMKLLLMMVAFILLIAGLFLLISGITDVLRRRSSAKQEPLQPASRSDDHRHAA